MYACMDGCTSIRMYLLRQWMKFNFGHHLKHFPSLLCPVIPTERTHIKFIAISLFVFSLCSKVSLPLALSSQPYNRIQKKKQQYCYLYLTSFGECLTYATINTQKYWRTLPNLFLTPREVTPISPLSTTIGYRQSSWTGFVSLRSGNEHTDQPQHRLVEKQLFTTSGSGGVFFVRVGCLSLAFRFKRRDTKGHELVIDLSYFWAQSTVRSSNV